MFREPKTPRGPFACRAFYPQESPSSKQGSGNLGWITPRRIAYSEKRISENNRTFRRQQPFQRAPLFAGGKVYQAYPEKTMFPQKCEVQVSYPRQSVYQRLIGGSRPRCEY